MSSYDMVSPDSLVKIGGRTINLYDSLLRVSSVKFDMTNSDRLIIPKEVQALIKIYVDTDGFAGEELYSYIDKSYGTVKSIYSDLNMDLHPIKVVQHLTKSLPDARVHFCRYQYEPSMKDYGEPPSQINIIFDVPASTVTDGWTLNMLNTLASNEDVTLNSNITLADGTTLHIPMIDFLTPSLNTTLDSLAKLTIKTGIRFETYGSGRSYHAYGSELLTPEAWHKFLGQVLLLHPVQKVDGIVDVRWVGHRILHQHAALRISCNSASYKKIPELNKRFVFTPLPDDANGYRTAGLFE